MGTGYTAFGGLLYAGMSGLANIATYNGYWFSGIIHSVYIND